MCILNTFIIIYFLTVGNLSKIAIGNYEKNSHREIMDNIAIGLLWVLVTNNNMLLS